MGKKKKKNGQKKMNFEKVYDILSSARKAKDVKPVKSAAESASVFTGTNYYGACHKGAQLAFVDPNTNQKYYGGGYSRDFDRVEGTILIALDDIVLDTIIVGNVPNMPNYEHNTIFIKWADYAAPRMSKEDWLKLLLALQATGKDVSIACMGGHGRTGTALAILGFFSGAIQDNPIAYIQKNYCREAVESRSQYEYIRNITGVDEMSGAPVARDNWDTATYSTYSPIAQYRIETNKAQSGDFINGYKPDGLDVCECKACGNEMFHDEAIYVGDDPFCEYCIQGGKAQEIIETCAVCGTTIDSETDIVYVIGGNTYCTICGEDIRE